MNLVNGINEFVKTFYKSLIITLEKYGKLIQDSQLFFCGDTKYLYIVYQTSCVFLFLCTAGTFTEIICHFIIIL